MPIPFQPWKIVLAALSEFVRKEQQKVIAYLQLENQILREKIGGKRVLLSDDQRRLLAVKGKALGRQQLKKIATVAQADTILRWHRELVELNTSTKPNQKFGRPATDKEIVDLVLRMARDNVSWGYKRIEGAMHNLGYSMCSSTVANILKQHGIEPAPTRMRTMSWSTFFKAHWDAFECINLATIILWFGELAEGIFGGEAKNERAHCATAAGSDDKPSDEASRLATLAISTRPTEARPARPPPPIRRGSISSRDIQHAA